MAAKPLAPCILCIGACLFFTEHHISISRLFLGMAGSGKTTFLQRLNAHLHQANKPCYVRPYALALTHKVVNLDPAVFHMPYEANIDIRDTVNYKEVSAVGRHML
jgi:GTPase SAR1 family protein